jgi:hypothetical protein
MIFKGSRYETVGTYDVTGPSGETIKALLIRYIPDTPAGFRHTVTSGERLDLLANTYYHQPLKFWLIADANNALDPEDLVSSPGQQVLIPPDRS